MNSGELHAWNHETRQPIRLEWQSGRIVSIVETAARPAKDVWVAPPLLDLQINGYAGVDFQQDGVAEEALLRAVCGLRRDGCSRFLLTVVTDEWPRMLARLRHFQTLRRNNEEVRQAVVGFHVEGPFLSPEPGFCGAHDPALMRLPTPAHFDELKQTTGSLPVLLTIAPELPGAIPAIAKASALGFHINLGHTDAAAVELAAATTNGARAFTHLGNGCPQRLDRHDNILWRVLDLERLTVSLIPDGHHVSPQLFRLIHRLAGERIYYTTDAMSAAGSGPGEFQLGKLQMEVRADGIVRFPGGTNFAGSSLKPIAGVFKAAEMLNRSWQQTWPFLSTAPAHRMGMESALEVGHPAEFCILEFPDPQNHSINGLQLTTVVENS